MRSKCPIENWTFLEKCLFLLPYEAQDSLWNILKSWRIVWPSGFSQTSEVYAAWVLLLNKKQMLWNLCTQFHKSIWVIFNIYCYDDYIVCNKLSILDPTSFHYDYRWSLNCCFCVCVFRSQSTVLVAQAQWAVWAVISPFPACRSAQALRAAQWTAFLMLLMTRVTLTWRKTILLCLIARSYTWSLYVHTSLDKISQKPSCLPA